MNLNIDYNKSGLTGIVPTNKAYSYDIMMHNIKELKRAYPFLEVKNIGNSVLGKEIPYVRIGNGAREILYHASIHANEWITSVLLMKFIENFCEAYTVNKSIQGYLPSELFKRVSLYIVPMVNPDGVNLVTNNIDNNSSEYKKLLDISKNFPKIPFPEGWKANYNGESLINFHLFVFKK